ncbi:putative dolichyl-P-Man:GDP-Man5GlcNAc2-PP-dolichyl alpha-1,2-mannosyltranslocase [Trypanosoma grayi]|uniref:putative dolichyl-P-Man:GDP-Man5GlcNAc2-PP-dolichyl alpha-1,2-mannosyltranslocase n=1 Tax=Trypanosoma grayi TaxID=71804 RepID=UPI0004F4638C|nr:putative dolichyl-P-Man:GDP-Man5GlcNAc2-PP-dolichyl alpha-1,2-mannosyltranslocase [Trypanosoma grayi]KEG11182.1 putative dolichyl-P-Man:GDP-Man5GlcNAc2-PP-dolichyl alpha-1,2-mannosyltranslocase [Trypanosoma grayi]
MNTPSDSGGGGMGFKGQLASALVLSVALKLVTFALTTVLTRQLTPGENGVSFSAQLYINTVLFLARECVRSVNARHNLRDKMSSGEAVLQVMNCAATSLPVGVAVMALMEVLSWCGIYVFPSLTAYSHVNGATSLNGISGGVSAGSTAMGLPELLLALSVVVALTAEPCIALVQSFDQVRIIVASEFWAQLVRLVVTLAFVKACGGLGGDPWTARLCFAVGFLAHAIMTVVYFVRLWNSSSEGAVLQQARKYAATARWGTALQSSLSWRKRVPWCFLSWRAVRVEAAREMLLLCQFFRESCLRLVLTEGERFALAAFGSAAAMGHYDLVANLGSLIARLIFRVWESACFVKWSRDAARGSPKEAAALLFTMLRVASYFGAAVLLLGPPLAEGFLLRIFSHRWASHEAVQALQLYCYLLPLLGWNGLLDAFVRATAAPPTLRLTQRVMVAQAAMYIIACFVVLRLRWIDDAVAGLIVVNGTSMVLRCVASVSVVLMHPIASHMPGDKVALQLKLWDFGAVCDARIAATWAALFACTRCASSGAAAAAAAVCAAPVFATAVVRWDPEIRLVLWSIVRR